MAEMAEQEDYGRVAINLYKADGSFKQQVHLPKENATKIIVMPDGVRYTQVQGTENWQAEASAPSKK
jgi:hypothetical protein